MRKENRMGKEVHKEVVTLMTRMMCDCGGEMVIPPGSPALSTYPPQYMHVCNKCEKVELYFKQYPCLDYIERN